MHAASSGPHSIGFLTLLTLGDTLPEIFIYSLVGQNSETWEFLRHGRVAIVARGLLMT